MVRDEIMSTQGGTCAATEACRVVVGDVRVKVMAVKPNWCVCVSTISRTRVKPGWSSLSVALAASAAFPFAFVLFPFAFWARPVAFLDFFSGAIYEYIDDIVVSCSVVLRLLT